MEFKQFLESSEHPVIRIKDLAEKLGWKYESATLNKQSNPNALKLPDGTYPVIISPEGVIIALDARDRYLHNGHVWMGDDIFPQSDKVTLAAIITPENLRGKGFASKALKELQQMADQLGMTVVGEPAQMKDFKGKKSLTKPQLLKWYKKNNWQQKYPDNDQILQYFPKKDLTQ